MQKQNILNKLASLKLTGMHQAFEAMQIPSSLDHGSLETLLHHLCDQQEINAGEQMLARNHRAAKLRWPDANLESIDYRTQHSLDKSMIVRLGTCEWITHTQHIAIIGKTGSGKTSLACALANQALQRGYKVRFFRFNELIVQLVAASNDDELGKFIKQLARFPVLVIDDWATIPLDPERRNVLFELIERREKQSSLIITSQYDYPEWHKAFQDDVIADAVLDRIVHTANKVVIEQDSLRKAFGIKGKLRKGKVS